MAVEIDVLGGFPPRIGARIFNSANESINNAAAVQLTFDSVRYNYGNLVTVANQFTIIRPGRYMIWAGVGFAASGAGTRRTVQLQKNGAVVTAQDTRGPTTAGNLFVTISTLDDLLAGETYQVVVFQDSGVALNVVTSANQSPEFAIQFIQ